MPGVPRSVCCWMIEHPEAGRVDPIAGDVHAVRRDGHERCGAGKIKAVLERRGVTASGRRIVDIMKRRGMRARTCAERPNRTGRGPTGPGSRTCWARGSDGYGPRAHLAGGLTYVRVGGEWAYVCLLIGLANRGIAGHGADTGRAAGLVMAAFATLGFPLTEVEVFRTDRGGGFDNAVVESTNRLLKKELIYRNHYTSLEQLRSDPDDYVWWSDNQRLHSTLAYRSPNEFTQQGLVL